MASYVSVTWTTGDVLTEAKLDNMVSNDQSETAHSANGMIMNNNVAYRAKQAGGTTKDVMKLGTDDVLRLSQVRTQVDNSNSITSATSENVITQYGWVQIDGAGSATVGETVTFPTAFTTVLGVLPGTLSKKVSSAATTITQLITDGLHVSSAEDVTTSNFLMRFRKHDGTTLTNGDFYGASWIAWGTKA